MLKYHRYKSYCLYSSGLIAFLKAIVLQNLYLETMSPLWDFFFFFFFFFTFAIKNTFIKKNHNYNNNNDYDNNNNTVVIFRELHIK